MNGVLHQKKLILHKAINTELSKSKKAKIFAYYKGFTIVELLVVIAVIAILAVLSVVAYLGITNQAHVASLSSGLADSAKALENYKVSNTITNTETYPAKLSDLTNLKLDNSINWTYYVQSSTDSTQNTTYCLQGTINNLTQSVSSSNPTVATKPCIENGLVGWWKLNGDAKDSSGNNNNGTIYGGVSNAIGEDGVVNHAMSFDGSSGYIRAIGTMLNSISPAKQVTVSLWVNMAAQPSNFRRIISSSIHGISYIDVYFNLTGSLGLYGTFAQNAESWLTRSDLNLANSKWRNLVFTTDTDSSLYRSYADGVLNYSRTIGLRPVSFDTLYLGASSDGSSSYLLSGLMDDVRIYDRTLSADEISSLYAAGAK